MLSFGITVKMANLSSVISRVQSPTCAIYTMNVIKKKQMAVQSLRLHILKGDYKGDLNTGMAPKIHFFLVL